MITVELPWPPRELSPNARNHWSVRQKAAKRFRRDAYLSVLAYSSIVDIELLLGSGAILVGLTFHPPSKRKHDVDNLVASLKAGLDGIADALRVDDNCFRLAAPKIGEPFRNGRVSVVLQGEGR